MMDPRSLIIDTGPLWELVRYRAFRAGYAALGDRPILRTEEQYHNLAAFTIQFRHRMTTPHVVAEISSRVVRSPKKGHSDLWRLVQEEFTKMKMREETLKLLEMPHELLVSLGAVDVSILKVVASFGPGTSTLLSIDGGLIKECRTAGLSALNLWEVIAAEVN